MPERPKIAAITTVFHKYSHTQHIVDRFLEGYGWEGRHHIPPMDLVSLYVDQVKENDLSRERADRFPSMVLYPTVADALTLGEPEQPQSTKGKGKGKGVEPFSGVGHRLDDLNSLD